MVMWTYTITPQLALRILDSFWNWCQRIINDAIFATVSKELDRMKPEIQNDSVSDLCVVIFNASLVTIKYEIFEAKEYL